MRITASQLREDVYSVLDGILETGVPVEVCRKGKVLKIIRQDKPSKLSRLKKRNIVVGDPDDLADITWADYWCYRQPVTSRVMR